MGSELFDKYDPDVPKAPPPVGDKTYTPLFDKYGDDDAGQAVIEKKGRVYVVPPGKERRGDIGGFNERMISAVPVVGPLFDKATAAVGAGIQGINADPSSTFGKRYENNLQMQEQKNEDFGKRNPISATAADIAGPTMLLGPMSATRTGASALGVTGTSLGTKVLKGGTTLGGIETANQLVKGNDPRDQGFFGPVPMSVVGGAAGPIIGEGANIMGNKLVEWTPPSSGPLRGTNSVTRNKLSSAVDAETPASIAAAKAAHGQSGMMMDTNQATRDIAGGLADIPGPAKGEIRENLRQRSAGQADRLRRSLDMNTVPQVNMRDLANQIEEYRNTTAKPLYDAFRTTKVHPTQEIKDLIPRLEKAGAFKLADELAGIRGVDTTQKFFTPGAQKDFPTAETWDLVKRGLDRRISTALDGGDKTLARELLKLKEDMLTEVEKTPGGKIWKQAREVWAEHTELLHQMEEGQKTFSRATRADDLAHELSQLSPHEQAARLQGARDAVNEIMTNTVNGATTARNKLLTEAGREKLELLFGPQRAQRLIRDLEAEVNVSRNTNEIVGGSPTSGKQARRDALLPARSEPGYLANINLTKPSTLVPDWMTPHAMMEGVSAARHAQAHQELGKIMQVPMRSPDYNDLIAAMRGEAARRSVGAAVSARRAGAVTGATQATSEAQGNRLSRPMNSEPELEGSRL